MVERILLGGAQLSGFRYGNLQAPLSRGESERILDAAWEIGVRGFDTAEAYGAAAHRLEQWLRARDHREAFVTTKVTPGAGIALRTSGAMTRFSAWLDTVYLHGLPPSHVLWESFAWATLSKAGASVYTSEDIAKVRRAGTPTRWQLPLKRFRLNKPKEPCDVRSIFDGGKDTRDPPTQLREALAMLRPQDRLVIGVDTPQHLEAIAQACAS